MKSILNNRFAPVTWRIGFIEAPLETVAQAHLGWHNSLRNVDVRKVLLRGDPGSPAPRLFSRRPLKKLFSAGGRGRWSYVLKPVDRPFPEILRSLEPLTQVGRVRELFLATDSSWTAYFDNGVVIRERIAPVTLLCQQLECRGLVAECTPSMDDAPIRAESVQFELIAPHPTHCLNHLRTIYATKESRNWCFGASGPVQPYERPERYAERRIADRFTPEMLEEYCAAIGIRYFDETFYGSRGILIHLSPSSRGWTFETAHKKVALIRS